nr:hypothetical protein [Pseudomonas syringae]UVN18303.1 hypothetical protein pPsy0462c_00044 [Pseudomonas syringae]
MKNEKAEAQIARYERIIKASTVMTKAEKSALVEWKKCDWRW